MTREVVRECYHLYKIEPRVGSVMVWLGPALACQRVSGGSDLSLFFRVLPVFFLFDPCLFRPVTPAFNSCFFDADCTAR